MSPHHLHHDDAVVALGGGVQLVDRLDRGIDGGVEAEGRDRPAHVVVDRLRHADDLHPALEELLRNGQRPVAADGDDGVDPEACGVVEDLAGAIDLDVGAIGLAHGKLERVSAVSRAQDRSAQVRDAAHRVAGQGDDVVFAEQAVIPTTDAEHVPSTTSGGQHGGANDGIEPRGVAATGRDRDAHLGARGKEGVMGEHAPRSGVMRQPSPVRPRAAPNDQQR